MDGRTTHQWILFNQVDAEHVTTYSHLNCSMTEWWWFQPRNESHISDDPQDIPRHPWAMTPWHDPFGSARRDASSSKPSIRRLLRRRVKPCPLGGLGKCLWNPLGIVWEPLGIRILVSSPPPFFLGCWSGGRLLDRRGRTCQPAADHPRYLFAEAAAADGNMQVI